MLSLAVDEWPDEPEVIDGWLYDRTKPDLIVDFYTRCLKHGTGVHAGKPFELLPWQKQIVFDLFGTFDPDTGLRRYTTAYIEVPRKNGKSQFAAGLALWLLCGDGEKGAQVYSAAFTLKQASLVFAMASQMVQADTALQTFCKVRKNTRTIYYENAGSFYRAIPRDDKDAHGLNAHGIIFDELHNQPDRKLWDTLQTSRGMRTQPMTIGITTAGHDRSSICYELHKQSKAVLNGDTSDPTFYPCIFAAHEDDDWQAETTWKKANPSLGHTVRLDYLRQECERAKQTASYENTFRNLHLNQWTEQSVRWLPMHAWDKCTGELPTTDVTWHMGVDLAETRDVPAVVIAAKDEDTNKIYIKPFLFMPEDDNSARSAQDKLKLHNWAAQGYIEKLPGESVNARTLLPEILSIVEAYNVQSIAFDPYRSRELINDLIEMGYPEDQLVKFPQTMLNFAEPSKTFLDLVHTKRLVHDGNEALRWMAANVVVAEDGNGNVKPMKNKSQDKIDGIVAAIMAIREATIPTNDLMPQIF